MRAVVIVLSILCSLFVPAASRAAGVTLVGDTCRKVFDNPRAQAISCRTGFQLDEATKSQLAANSFGLLSDLSCSIHIKANRAEVISHVLAGGEVALPPQAVECRLVSGNDPVQIRFRLAPVVRIEKGRAVDARLGIRDVSGIPEPLATAVAEMLNHEPTLRQNLITAANQIIPNLPRHR